MLVPILVVLSTLVPVSVAVAQTETATPASTPAATGTRHYAVSLLSSFEPIPDALLPVDLRAQRIYRTQADVFGKTIFFVRLGFFATQADATAKRDELVARFPGAFVTEVTAQEFAATQPSPPAKVEKPVVKPAPKPVTPREDIYTITLAVSEKSVPRPAGPLPADLSTKRLYLHDVIRSGVTQHSLQLGFFSSIAEAETARRLLFLTYPEADIRTASRQEQNASTRTVVATPSTGATRQAATAVPPASAVSNSAVDKPAADLMERGRAALTRGDNAAAIQLLNQLLKLPPNSQTAEAQELIGLAHERNGEISMAKKEYKLCLMLYPEGEGAERVRQRLANLEAAPASKGLMAAKKKEVNVNTVYGGLSQYYYRGNSRAEITQTVGPTLDQTTLTALDQSALITNLDITGRFRNGDYDNRVVIRDSYTLNFLPNTENINRLYAAYGEVRNKLYDYSVRVGRQPGNSGGVLGRFDGISMGYGFQPKWRANLVAGIPVEFNPINSDKLFWGTSLDVGTFAEHWNGSAYYIIQTVDQIVDRQAVGTELRYFDPRRSLLSLIDYDVTYGELNIALLQATQQIGSGTSLNLLIDHRKAPVLQTTNALLGETNTSIRWFLDQGMTEEQLRALAEARTPTADLIMLGATHNFNTTWQLGGDIKWYSISGTPASGAPPATTTMAYQGTGDVYVYTVQGIGTGLLTKRDVSVLSLSYLTGETYDGESIAFNNRTLYQDKWTFDLSLRYYQQKDNLGTDLTRLTPIVRVGYRWRDKITFELEAGMEKGQTTSSTQTEDTTRNFYSLGYRWDF